VQDPLILYIDKDTVLSDDDALLAAKRILLEAIKTGSYKLEDAYGYKQLVLYGKYIKVKEE